MGEAGLEENTQISAQHSNFLKNLSKHVRECVGSLRLIQEKYDALKAEFDKDRASIQAKYLQSCQTLYAQISLVEMPERSKKKLMALTTNVMRDDSDKGLGLQVMKYLAAKYEELGCEVKWMGKPDKVI
ncbi:uncharacterized protein LOC133736316 [Rosa rugosa]|uniref:uncharacterized protein LOC133736316 n=1 Tax=Rosa rugosa TaxID=74645 RepID=UPI002B41852C|nr:uncharacterized protein LOC133736316 [Rosa rugosa]